VPWDPMVQAFWPVWHARQNARALTVNGMRPVQTGNPWNPVAPAPFHPACRQALPRAVQGRSIPCRYAHRAHHRHSSACRVCHRAKDRGSQSLEAASSLPNPAEIATQKLTTRQGRATVVSMARGQGAKGRHILIMQTQTAEPDQQTIVISIGKRALTKSANRAAILESARQVFAELGYEATTVRDIIRRTGLASGTFYNYFKSKEEVFHALHDDGLTRFKPLLRAAREAAAGDFEAFLIRAYTAYFHFLRDQGQFTPDVAQRPDWTRVRFDTPESLALFDELKADLIHYGETGALAGVDPEMLTASCVGMAQEIGDRMIRGRVRDLDEAARFATAMTLGGVARLKGTPA
jgi:AcrR family transcriptional regulator